MPKLLYYCLEPLNTIVEGHSSLYCLIHEHLVHYSYILSSSIHCVSTLPIAVTGLCCQHKAGIPTLAEKGEKPKNESILYS